MKFWCRELPIRVDEHTPQLSVCLTRCHKLLFTCLLSLPVWWEGCLARTSAVGAGGRLSSIRGQEGNGRGEAESLSGRYRRHPIEGLVPSHCGLFQGLLCSPEHPRGVSLCYGLSFVHPTSHQAHCPVSPEILPDACLPPALCQSRLYL